MVVGIGLRSVVRALCIAAGLALLVVATLSFRSSTASAQTIPSDFADITIQDEIFSPISMAMAPDGRLVVLTDTGRAFMIKDDVFLPTPVFDLRGKVDTNGSQGLQSIAFDNNFEQTGFIYVIYTFDTSGNTTDGIGRNRLVRFTMNGDVATNETLIYNNFPVGDGISLHYGGAVEVGNDGKIYTTVGDYLLGANGQDRSNVAGTVLRLNKNGTIPNDNPFFGELTGANRAIYAYGLRNPFQTALRESDGEIFISDVGANRFEELNVLERGGNYGWFEAEGPKDPNDPSQNSFVDPLWSYRHIDTFPNDPLAGCAIVGGSFYESANMSFPSRYHDQYFTGDFCTGQIYVVNPNSGAAEVFGDTPDLGLVDMAVNPVNGDLYYLHQRFRGDQDFPAGGIGKISFIGQQTGITITSQPQDVSVAVGASASFFVGATGPGDVTYLWTRNGVAIPGATSPRLTIDNLRNANDGDLIRVQVRSEGQLVRSRIATVNITNNTAPVPRITVGGLVNGEYIAGRGFNFFGSATDAEDGTIPGSRLTWDIRLNHDDHDHELSTALGANGSVTVPRDIETSTNVWVTLYLTATDASGTATTVSRRVDPRIVDITLASSPNGLDVTLEGTEHRAPFTFDSVAGVRREISAPATQTAGGVNYTFDEWSDGLSRAQPRVTPNNDITLTARYTGNGNGGGDICTVTAVNGGIRVDWVDKPGFEQVRTSTAWVASRPNVTSYVAAGGSTDQGWRIRRDGVDEVCEIEGGGTPPPPGDTCTVLPEDGGVRIDWVDKPGNEQVRTATAWIAARPNVTSFFAVGGTTDQGWTIRRDGVDEVCIVQGGTPPPPPPPPDDVCTVTAVNGGGIRVEWVDKPGPEQIRNSSGWVAARPNATRFFYADGTTDQGWRIVRNGVTELCEVVGGGTPPPANNCFVQARAAGGVTITWQNKAGTEVLRNSNGWVATPAAGTLTFVAPNGALNDGWLIRRDGTSNEVCVVL